VDVFDDVINKDIRRSTNTGFTDDYKNEVFTIWYNLGKPIASVLFEKIPIPETNYGIKPAAKTMWSWISSDAWRARAKELDAGVQKSVDLVLIQTKVEMLERHAQVGTKMQDIALEYLEEHAEEMSAPAAVRLLVEGIRIERESRSIPEALAKLTSLSDEQLLKEIVKTFEEAPLEDEIIDE